MRSLFSVDHLASLSCISQLTLNMAKTHIIHVNDGFVFLGHRIIRKRGPRGSMRPVTTIPWAKYRDEHRSRRLIELHDGNIARFRLRP